ncbi:hypothetical protein BJ508DRAFT_205508, partial [Ascobolus immersus RN42]
TLNLVLDNGVLRDNLGRQGYIASNGQLQFDEPPQENALVTEGFTICQDTGRLMLLGEDTFYSCLSGDFSNIYDRKIAPQCVPVYVQVIDPTLVGEMEFVVSRK